MCLALLLVATIGALVNATIEVEMQRPTTISRAKINKTLEMDQPMIVKLGKIPDRVEGIGWKKHSAATRRL